MVVVHTKYFPLQSAGGRDLGDFAFQELMPSLKCSERFAPRLGTWKGRSGHHPGAGGSVEPLRPLFNSFISVLHGMQQYHHVA